MDWSQLTSQQTAGISSMMQLKYAKFKEMELVARHKKITIPNLIQGSARLK